MNTSVTPAPATSLVESQDSDKIPTPAPATSVVASQDSDKNPTPAPATAVVASQDPDENPNPAPATSVAASQDAENPTNQETTNDVVMGDVAAPAQKPQDDENLPPWLAAKINYLRGVTDDPVWQNLVTDFVDFEKAGPPNGVSSFQLFFFCMKLETKLLAELAYGVSTPGGLELD